MLKNYFKTVNAFRFFALTLFTYLNFMVAQNFIYTFNLAITLYKKKYLLDFLLIYKQNKTVKTVMIFTFFFYKTIETIVILLDIKN